MSARSVAILLGISLCVASAPVSVAKAVLEEINQPWTGDFDAMLKHRKLRALVVYNDLLYFLDGATQRGAAHDALKLFEEFVNKKYKLKTRKFHVVFVPVARDQLIPALEKGLGDVAAANLTITPERQRFVDFSNPVNEGVSEVLVTGPAAPDITKRDDLAGQTIYVRKSSSYFPSLTALNGDFRKRKVKRMKLVAADEYLEDSDLLEMVNAGLLSMVIVDSHKAEFWKDVLGKIKTHPNITVREGGKIAWAIRKNSPILKVTLNEFVAKNKKGTLNGNIILKRYFKDNKWVRNSLAEKEIKKFESMFKIFQRYAGKYEFDWLMLMALAYQESRLDQNKRSNAGAIGVMQLMPATARDSNVGIPKIEKLENNVHAGTKYLRFIRDRYFSDSNIDALNQTFFSFAAYNAGPRRIAKLRKETKQRQLDPEVWFNNVEVIAARQIGRETVQYVSNIYKYYIAYKLVVKQTKAREQARKDFRKRVR